MASKVYMVGLTGSTAFKISNSMVIDSMKPLMVISIKKWLNNAVGHDTVSGKDVYQHQIRPLNEWMGMSCSFGVNVYEAKVNGGKSKRVHPNDINKMVVGIIKKMKIEDIDRLLPVEERVWRADELIKRLGG